MHRATDYIHKLFKINNYDDPIYFNLEESAVGHLGGELYLDSLDYYYSALLSVGDALNGIARGRYSWSIVMLYYSTFYCARAILGLNSYGLVAVESKEYLIEVRDGQKLQKAHGHTTHDRVLKAFVEKFKNSMLLTEVNGDCSFWWMKNRRNEANYKNSRFIEPEVPEYFYHITKYGIETVILQYFLEHCNNNKYELTFQPEHAALAFPLLLLKRCRDAIYRNRKGLEVSEEHLDLCKQNCSMLLFEYFL